jgi:chemotaxis protein CheX
LISKEIEYFIELTNNFFDTRNTGESLVIETPYLTKSIIKLLQPYTTRISISGKYYGNLYLTAEKKFVEKVIQSFGKTNFAEERIVDALGEVANTISGNAREFLGRQFVISVPHFCKNNVISDEFSTGMNSYVIPFKWHNCKALLIVSYSFDDE